MHVDLEDGVPTDMNSDVCVIGAGAAGITVARRLLSAGKHVMLLESGGTDYAADTSALNSGRSTGEPYYPLDHARLRFFGGTTAIWGGRCAELDPIDFRPRPWVPYSGWPIDYEELTPYYVSARQALGLPETWPTRLDFALAGAPLPVFSDALLRTPLWTFDERFNRFTFDACSDLRAHPRCTILTHATVTEIVAAPSGKVIDYLDVRSRSGRRYRVRAGNYVLSTGGIENARLLLASNSIMPMGLGNEHDQVGRYFMEHPHARGGRIVGPGAWALLKAFGRKHRVNGGNAAALIAPSERLQKERGLLNTSLTIAGRRPAGGHEALGMRVYQKLKHDLSPGRRARALWLRTKQAAHMVMNVTEPFRPWLLHKAGRLDIALVVRGEQAPNPDSRVTLQREVDAYGVPRVQLDWRLSALDTDSVAGLVDALGEEVARLGLGQVEAAPWLSDPSRDWCMDPLISAHPIAGYHHIGTTRMAENSRFGVTDGAGRVHGIANLYVAGSSLFPTSGWANPTLTIIALAQRTADIIVAGQSSDSDWQAAVRWNHGEVAAAGRGQEERTPVLASRHAPT